MAKKPDIKNLLVKFGKASIGSEKCSMSVRFERGNLDLATADTALCGARVQAQLRVDPNAEPDVEGQTRMIDTDIVVDSTADIAGINVHPDVVTATMQFQRSEIDVSRFATLSQRAGRLTTTRVGDSGASADSGEGE